MTVEERKIYDLVVRRFIAVLYPPFEYEQTELTVELAGENFAAKGKIVKNAGWREVYDGQDDDEDDEEAAERLDIRAQKLPDLKRGDRIPKLSVTMTEGKTKPPARLMRRRPLPPWKIPLPIWNQRIKPWRRRWGDRRPGETVATRADIIEKLFSSFLLENGGKDIFLTSKAKQLLTLVPEDLRKLELTADWGDAAVENCGWKAETCRLHEGYPFLFQ